MPKLKLTLSALPGLLAVCRLGPQEEIPAWATGSGFLSISRTADELSIVCLEEYVPCGTVCQRGWRAIKFEGPFDFSAVGILVAVASLLAEAGISILAISTYDTDYVLVRESQLQKAAGALAAQGHIVRLPDP